MADAYLMSMSIILSQQADNFASQCNFCCFQTFFSLHNPKEGAVGNSKKIFSVSLSSPAKKDHVSSVNCLWMVLISLTGMTRGIQAAGASQVKRIGQILI